MENIKLTFDKESYTLTRQQYLDMFMLINELRDAIQVLTGTQIKLHNLDLTLAERTDRLLEHHVAVMGLEK